MFLLKQRNWPVEVEWHEALSLRLVSIRIEEDTPLGRLLETNVQLSLGRPQHQLGGAGDLGELGDPHDEAVLHVASAGVKEGIVSGSSGTAQHYLGRGLGQVLVLSQVLSPIGQDAVRVLQHRLHHPPLLPHQLSLLIKQSEVFKFNMS